MNKALNIFLVFFLSLVVVFNFIQKGDQVVQLAESFLLGKTYFIQKPLSWFDTSFFNELNFLPSGVFPIVILTPFVFLFQKLGLVFYQGYMQPFLVIGIFFLIYKISRRLNYGKDDSLYWSFAFSFSTVFLGVSLMPAVWGYTQVLSTLLLFLIIYGLVQKFPPLILGILVGMAAATRFTTIGMAVLILFLILTAPKNNLSLKIKKVILFAIPIIFWLSVVLFYNYVRFGDVLETGYGYPLLEIAGVDIARSYGMFSTIHLPGNLYLFLLSTPLVIFKDNISHVLSFPFVRANPWGMSIFITSPILLKLFFLKHKDVLSKAILVTVVIIAIPIFLYYGVGVRQMGYRYSLDFLPLLFWLLMKNYNVDRKTLSTRFKYLILISSMLNLYFFMTIYVYEL